MDRIKNLSLRKTIILYLAVSLAVSFFLSAAVVRTASRIQERIWWDYIDRETYYEAMQGEKSAYVGTVARPANSSMTKADLIVSELCDFLQTYAVLIFSIAASCAAVFLFYRHKIAKPLDELKAASALIAKEELDFRISYENRDELGQLCNEFEKMRSQLAQNNERLWRMVEEEKALRAAIAHDIRSPLTVLKGYQEMLLEFTPDGTFTREKILEILKEEMGQTERMERFIDSMREMSSLENRELRPEPFMLARLKAELESEAGILCRKEGKELRILCWNEEEEFFGDREMILEVFENLLTNALRYAREVISVQVKRRGQELEISVADDGAGFKADTETLTGAFYQENAQDSLKHSGLGMYISRIFCEKHGGRLVTANGADGGAVVKAVFRSGAAVLQR